MNFDLSPPTDPKDPRFLQWLALLWKFIRDYVASIASTVWGVSQGGTGLSSGTSGGIPGYTSTTTMASSVLLTQNAIVLGGGAGATPTPFGSLGTTTTLLHGNASGAPTWGSVVEVDISLSNNSTNDATAARHGFLPILSNVATQFLNGQGAFATPSGTAASYKLQAFSAQTSVTVTHNFGTYPVVQIIDNANLLIIPLEVTHNTLNDFTVTFTSSTTGNIVASVGSPQPQALTVVAADYTVLTTDMIVKITAAAKTMTLYTAVGNTGREVIINNASSGTCFVEGDGTETISTVPIQVLPSRSSMAIYSDGANWQII